jgi:hypothetical protein
MRIVSIWCITISSMFQDALFCASRKLGGSIAVSAAAQSCIYCTVANAQFVLVLGLLLFDGASINHRCASEETLVC